jgi:hypothetical protein
VQRRFSSVLGQPYISENDQEQIVQSSLALEPALHSLNMARKTYWIFEAKKSSPWLSSIISWLGEWIGVCYVPLRHGPIDRETTKTTLELLVQMIFLKSLSPEDGFSRSEMDPYLVLYKKKAHPIDVRITGRGVLIAGSLYPSWKKALLFLQQPTPEEILSQYTLNQPKNMNLDFLSHEETLYWIEKVETSYVLSLQKKDFTQPSHYEIIIEKNARTFSIDLKDGSQPIRSSTIEGLHEGILHMIPHAVKCP